MQTNTVAAAGHTLSDAALAQRIVAGEPGAFEILMRRYNRPLYRTARSVLRDDAEAEDALQDAYLLAYRKISQFRCESSLSTWLTRIVLNAAIARSRKGKRRAQIFQLDGACEPGNQPKEETMDDAVAPEQPEHAAQRAEVRRLLERKIDELPDGLRTVLVLRALEELSVEETAAVLGIPETTVRTRFFRARGRLREALSHEIDFAFEEAFRFDGARCDRIVSGVLARLVDAATGDA